MALARDHGGHREQGAGGRRSGSELGAIDTRLGDMDAVGRQRIEVEQRSPRPGARRDDGSGSREHLPLALAAQRHVDERDEPQASCLRDQHLGRRRRDEPVEQHERSVRDRADDCGETQRARARRATATSRRPRASARPSPPRRGRRRRAGRRRCLRSAEPDRRCLRGRRSGRPSQLSLVGRGRDMRLVQRDHETVELAGDVAEAFRPAGRRHPSELLRGRVHARRGSARRRDCGS